MGFINDTILNIFKWVFPEIKSGLNATEAKNMKNSFSKYLEEKYATEINSWQAYDFSKEEMETKKKTIIQMEIRCWKDKTKEEKIQLLKKYS